MQAIRQADNLPRQVTGCRYEDGCARHGFAKQKQAHRGDGICLCLKPLHAHWAIIIRFDILPLQALVSVEPLDFLRSRDAGRGLLSRPL
jgi:hypothetical protein